MMTRISQVIEDHELKTLWALEDIVGARQVESTHFHDMMVEFGYAEHANDALRLTHKGIARLNQLTERFNVYSAN
jgi:hypothetical protein